MSSVYTVTGKLGGPFVLRTDEDTRAMAVFANLIMATSFIAETGQDAIEPTIIPSDTFSQWIDLLIENGMTHIAVSPPSPNDLHLVAIKDAKLLALLGTR